MPELPEVETIRRDLNRKICHKTIKQVTICKGKVIRGKARDLQRYLIGKSFSRVGRRAKLLIFDLVDGEKSLLIHLKMTGQLIYKAKRETVAGGHSWPPPDRRLPNKYSHVFFVFSDGSRLYFNDLRQFGYLQLVDGREKEKIKSAYGLEPLTPSFTFPAFKDALSLRKTRLKSVLLNQQVIAGIGNIYADEICHAAHLRPDRVAATLKLFELKALYTACQKILDKAIAKRGTTFSDYVDADGQTGNYVKYLRVYQCDGRRCRTCQKGIIKRIKIGSRGTHYCPVCQK